MSKVVQIIFVVALLELVADIFLKKWSKGEIEINMFLLLGILVYMIVAVLYAFFTLRNVKYYYCIMARFNTHIYIFTCSIIFQRTPKYKTINMYFPCINRNNRSCLF